jgi:sugar/nucleoside kinase (ribokinase family)
MLTYPGSVADLRDDELDTAALYQARHIHMSSYFLQTGVQPGIASIFREARTHGLTVSLDTGWDPDGKWDGQLERVLPNVDVFLPNAREAMAISRAPDAWAALAELAEIVPVVAIKMGSAGALIRAGGRSLRVGSYSVAVVDTAGAGDSFDAGFLYGYLNGLSLEQSARIGCACGALSATRPGGIDGQPSLEQLARFMEETIPLGGECG